MNDENDSVEQRLNQMTPGGVRPEVREKVLAAVAEQLQSAPSSPWLRLAAMAVAASLLLGVGSNVWVSKAADRRLAELFGPSPISKRAMEIAKDVERVTDAETGQWVYRQLNVPVQPGDVAAAYAKYFAEAQKLMDRLRTVSKDSYHETPQKESEMDRSRPGRIDGNSIDCQRHLRFDYRCAA